MKITRTIITAAILMAAAYLPAQNKSAGINLSLWEGISTQPLDSAQTTYFNIGFVSSMNRLNGIGVNALVGATRREMNGIQLSGLANTANANMRGIQISGISNINRQQMIGISASGLVCITGNNTSGVIISGLTNIFGNNTAGLMVSGLMNISGNMASGVQLSGLSNITGLTFEGIMSSGFMNVVGKDMNGLQIAGLGNIVAHELNGVQIGISNYATTAHGVQIGLVNYYRNEMKGFQLGLINANPHTKVQMMVYGGNSTLVNVGARFKNELFYTILGIGSSYPNFNDKFSATASYRAGLSFPIYRRLSLGGDLGYQHIETFKNKNEVIPRRLYALQGRVNLEYQLTSKFGVFATGGYGLTKYYTKAQNFDKGAIIEAGITLF